jgi:hypothetical protein
MSADGLEMASPLAGKLLNLSTFLHHKLRSSFSGRGSGGCFRACNAAPVYSELLNVPICARSLDHIHCVGIASKSYLKDVRAPFACARPCARSLHVVHPPVSVFATGWRPVRLSHLHHGRFGILSRPRPSLPREPGSARIVSPETVQAALALLAADGPAMADMINRKVRKPC